MYCLQMRLPTLIYSITTDDRLPYQSLINFNPNVKTYILMGYRIIITIATEPMS